MMNKSERAMQIDLGWRKEELEQRSSLFFGGYHAKDLLYAS